MPAWSTDCDLLVIGAGVAGLTATVGGRDLGLDVPVVDHGARFDAEIQRALEHAAAGTRLLQNAHPMRIVLDDDGGDAAAAWRETLGCHTRLD